MGVRYGRLSRDEKFRGLTPRVGSKPTTRDRRIRLGNDSITEAIAGIERKPEDLIPAKDFMDEDGQWVEE